MITYEELFREAEKYGKVRIHSSDSREAPECYSCIISFNTIKHVELEAKSGYGLTVGDALKAAIKNAVLVVESVSGIKCESSEEVIKRLES